MKQFFKVTTGTTGAMLVLIAITMLAAFLSPTINWVAIIWMVISAMWVVCSRVNQLTSEGLKQLYDSTVDELAKLRKKYQVLDDEYQKIVKGNEEASKENVELHERLAGLTDTVAKYEAAAQKPAAKKPSPRTTKREYTEQDKARIREEMKVVGVKPEAKKRKPVEDED